MPHYVTFSSERKLILTGKAVSGFAVDQCCYWGQCDCLEYCKSLAPTKENRLSKTTLHMPPIPIYVHLTYHLYRLNAEMFFTIMFAGIS